MDREQRANNGWRKVVSEGPEPVWLLRPINLRHAVPGRHPFRSLPATVFLPSEECTCRPPLGESQTPVSPLLFKRVGGGGEGRRPAVPLDLSITPLPSSLYAPELAFRSDQRCVDPGWGHNPTNGVGGLTLSSQERVKPE